MILGSGSYSALMSALGKSHGRRSMVGYSPWGRKESDMTEQLYLLTYLLTYLMSALGEGNGTPLQHSCLENPMGGGAW